MTEEIKKYGEKSITYTELADFMYGFAEQKIIENDHKSNPFDLGFATLLNRMKEEIQEFEESYSKWFRDKSDVNAVEVLREIADFNIFSHFIGGKIAGYTKLERR